ncbi:MAG TPA: hypothetical protein PK976_07405, partial [Bacteroidales bacterium]|nr:hypothetical protein [Bacteroidales bacterium]
RENDNLMQTIDNIFYKPRKYNTIELWKDVKEEQWNDVNWQRRNSIRSVAQLKKIIKLNEVFVKISKNSFLRCKKNLILWNH